MGALVTSILGIVVVGLSRAFFSMGRLKTITEAKISFIDYEKAFIDALGSQAMTSLSACNVSALSNLDFPVGQLGSAKSLKDPFKNSLANDLGVNGPSPGTNQIALNQAFTSCPTSVPTNAATAPGVYNLCLGFQGNQGGFKGLVGAFAKVRLDLGSRANSSNQRVLGQATTCNSFKLDAQREIKISYTLYFKKFQDDLSIFSKSGVQFFSN